MKVRLHNSLINIPDPVSEHIKGDRINHFAIFIPSRQRLSVEILNPQKGDGVYYVKNNTYFVRKFHDKHWQLYFHCEDLKKAEEQVGFLR